MEMKTYIQHREAMPDTWRAPTGLAVEGAQQVKVLTPPSTLRG